MNSQTDTTYFSSLDFLKAFAMFAVINNHITVPLFKVSYSIYSVTLFIFVAGMTSVISVEKSNFEYSPYLKKKFLPLISWYLFALVAYIFIEQRFFSFNFFLHELRTFGLEVSNGHLYYLAFYSELMLISPFIVKLYSCRNANIIKNFLLLCISIILSFFFYRYTHIEGLALASQYVLGGSYFFVLNIGIFYWVNIKKFLVSIVSNIFCLVFSIFLFVYFQKNNYIDLSWSNPPNLYTIFYTLIIFFFLNSLHNLLISLFEKLNLNTKSIFLPIFIVGKNSLYIYLFHMVIVEIIDKNNVSGTIIIKLLGYIGCLYLPILFVFIVKKMLSKIQTDIS